MSLLLKSWSEGFPNNLDFGDSLDHVSGRLLRVSQGDCPTIENYSIIRFWKRRRGGFRYYLDPVHVFSSDFLHHCRIIAHFPPLNPRERERSGKMKNFLFGAASTPKSSNRNFRIPHLPTKKSSFHWGKRKLKRKFYNPFVPAGFLHLSLPNQMFLQWELAI